MTSKWGRITLAAALALTCAAAVSADPETLNLSGHHDQVTCVAFSPDGRQIATSSDDASVRIWDVESGTEQRAIKVHEGHVVCVAWTTDGRFLMSGGDSGHMKVTDLRGREVREIDFHESIKSMAVCSDGSLVAFGLGGGSLRVVDAKTWTQTKDLGIGPSVESIAFSADGTMMAVGDAEGTVSIFDPRSGKKQRRCVGHTDEVKCVNFNKDGTLLASASNDHTIRLWDPATGRTVRTLLGHANHVFGVAFSPDGSKLASAGHDETVRMWDPATGKEKECWEGGHTSNINTLAYRADGKVLATGSADKTVVLWFLDKGKVKDPVPPPPPPPPDPPRPDLKKITRTQIDAVATSLSAFESDMGYLPHSVNRGMVNALSRGKRGGYYRFDKSELNAQGEVIDAWGNPLCYHSPGSKGSKFDLYSSGPNGKDDCGAGDDIGNW
ncbi:MAG: type II secretion system protein GspG [Planctomycetes bacterium]|nr:type II secretion system protein GspG [Planctomycetota bacterium]